MKGAALIFGLLAGLLGAWIVALGNLEAGLAASGAFGPNGSFVSKLVIYLIPNLGLLGAGIALGRPRLGGLLMLLSAAAWAGVALLAGHGAVLFAALPFTFAGAGGVVALFASRRHEAEEEPEDRAPVRHWEEATEPPMRAGSPRARFADAARAEPAFDATRRPRREPPPPVLDEEVEDEPVEAAEPPQPEPDYIDAEEAIEEPPVEEEDDSYPYEEIEPTLEEEAEEPEPAEEEYSYPEDELLDHLDWVDSEPEAEPEDEPEEDAQRPAAARPYAAEQQAARPARREPAPPPPPPPPRPRAPVRSSYTEPTEEFVLHREAEPRPQPGYREFDADEPRPRRRRPRSPLGGYLRGLIGVLALVVVVGLGAAVYFDHERGPQSLLFGRHESPAVAENQAPPPVPAEVAVSTPAEPVPAPQAAVPTSPGETVPAAAPNSSATVEVPTTIAPPPGMQAPDEAPAQPSAATGTTDIGAVEPTVPAVAPTADAGSGFTDPFRYCEAVTTVDAPDSRFAGPAVPHAVAAALQLPDDTPADQVRWRCANQSVLACNVNHSSACDPTPTVGLMISYCAQHPNTQNIPAPNGTWSCTGTRPVIPPDAKWPVDARGFFPDAWKPVSPMNAG